MDAPGRRSAAGRVREDGGRGRGTQAGAQIEFQSETQGRRQARAAREVQAEGCTRAQGRPPAREEEVGTGPVAVRFLIPSYLRPFTGGEGRIELAARPATVGEALALLRARHPGVGDRVLTEQGDV